MVKNFFSFSPKTGTIFSTVLFLLVIGAGYFFWYVPNNQSELERRQFRCLQNIDRNAKEKIDNSLALIKDLMDNYTDPQRYNRDSVLSYIKHFSNKNFRLGYRLLHKKDAVVSIDADTLLKVNGKVKNDFKTILTINRDVILIQLQNRDILMQIEYTFKDFIEPMLPGGIFDNYIILKNQNVIYQSFPSGMVAIARDTLANTKVTYSKGPLRDLRLSGNSYKLFSQQMALTSDSTFTVAGLLSSEKYSYERNKLPREVVIFLMIIAIAGILALPWIKLYQMGSQDRMTASDGIFCMAVPMLLISVLFFVFFCYNAPSRPEWGFDQSAISMFERINTQFKNEVSQTYDSLEKAEPLIREGDTGNQEKLNVLAKSLSVIQINVLDSNGQERRNWSPKAIPAPFGDYSDRNYFSNLKKHRAFYIDNDTTKQYYLEPVISRTTNNFTTVICRSHLADKTYTTISFNLRCLKNPVMTPGFQYSVVSDDGRVLYHSDPAKQLNENLFTEFSDSATLAANVHARTKKHFSTKYAGKRFEVLVSPLEGLPFSLVIMEDTAFKSMRQINSFVFSFSMLFLFFIILGIELLVIFLVSLKSTYYRKHYFDISWIGPNSSFMEEYRVAFWGNCAIIIVLLICWYTGPGFLEFVFIFLAVANLSFIFQNYLYARRYAHEKDVSRCQLKKNAAWVLVALLIFLNISSAVVAFGWRFFLFETLIIAVLSGIFNKTKIPITLEEARQVSNDEIGKSYSLMNFSRLIITSGLPVALFFITTYNYEIQLTTRYRQAKFISEVLNKGVKNSKGLDAVPIYCDGVWINRYNFLDDTRLTNFSVDKKADADNELTNNTVELFDLLFIDHEQLVPGLAEMARYPQDALWHFSNILSDKPAYGYYDLHKGNHLFVKALPTGYSLLFSKGEWYKAALFWLTFFGALYGFWYMFYHVIKRLFGLNLPSDAGWEIIDDLLLKENAINNLLFLIGPPGSGKLNAIVKQIKAGKITGKGDTLIFFDEKYPKKNELLYCGYVHDT